MSDYAFYSMEIRGFMAIITKPTTEPSNSHLLHPSFEIHCNILLPVADSVEPHSDYWLLSVFYHRTVPSLSL